MNNKNSSRIVLQYFLALVIFIAVTADRNLLISHFIGYKTNQLITLIFVSVFLFRYLSESIIRGSIKYERHIKSLLDVLVLISFYFLIHNILFPTSLIPIKYSLLSFVIIIFITKKIDLTSIINGFAIIGLFLSISIILQQLLLILFHSGNLSGFHIIIDSKDVFRYSKGFVSPYGLGLIEYAYSPIINFSGGEYWRPTLFSHEPKHASSIILLTLSTVLVSKYSLASKKIMIWIHLIAILLIMSFSSYLILLITLVMYFVHKKKIFPIYYVPAVLIIPFILAWLIELTLPLLSSPDSLFYLRLLSAETTSGYTDFSIPSLFASGAYPDFKYDKDSMLYYIYGQYGLVAIALVVLFLYVFIKYINKQFTKKHFSSMSRFSSILLVNIFILYNLYVFSDFLNLFSTAIIILVIYICDVKKFIIINNKWRFN